MPFASLANTHHKQIMVAHHSVPSQLSVKKKRSMTQPSFKSYCTCILLILMRGQHLSSSIVPRLFVLQTHPGFRSSIVGPYKTQLGNYVSQVIPILPYDGPSLKLQIPFAPEKCLSPFNSWKRSSTKCVDHLATPSPYPA